MSADVIKIPQEIINDVTDWLGEQRIENTVIYPDADASYVYLEVYAPRDIVAITIKFNLLEYRY